MIGFNIRFDNNEQTDIILDLVSWLTSIGVKTKLISYGSKLKNTQDRLAKIHNMKIPLSDNFDNCKFVVWSYDVCGSALDAARSKGAKTVIISTLDDEDKHLKLYYQADKIVCMSPSLTSSLRAILGNKKVIYTPVDFPFIDPILTKLHGDRLRIILNLKTAYKHPLPDKLVKMMAKWFKSYRAAWTVWCNRGLLHRNRWLRTITSNLNNGSSLIFRHKVDLDTQKLMYMYNDVMIWPSIHLGHSAIPVMSLLKGCPVVTFDVPPANEYLSAENSVITPVYVDDKHAGMLAPNLYRFNQAVVKLFHNLESVANMKKHTADWTEARRKLYFSGWKAVFEL